MTDFNWMIGGEAGFGIMTTGVVFSKIATRLGYHIFDYVEYPSLIRGGHNAYEIHVSDVEVGHLKPTIDVLVCLNKETFDKHALRLTKDSVVVYDETEFKIEGDYKKVSIPFKKIVADLKGQAVMKNTIALGASMAVVGAPLDELLKIIEEQFARKGETVVSFNKEFAKTGFDFVTKNSPQVNKWLIKKDKIDPKLVLTGNEAFSLGAVISDCRLYSAYPMTPSSSVLTVLASWQAKNNMIVRHAEDEISVINTALGASFAGARAAVGTSGGGFALMVETVSLAGITETPLVVFLSQRPGPATGMPTWTEQGDLLFTVHSGHGEFPKIVLSPGTAEEMIELTGKAFNLADVYQLPVIVMSDMFLSEGHKSVSKKFVDNFIANYKVNRGKLLEKITNDKSQMTNQDKNSNFKSKNFLRYKLAEDGISERLIPGVPGYFFQANSYEHIEDGHTTEEAQPRIDQVNKRAKKWLTYLQQDFKLPEFYGDKDAQLVFVSWGSNKGAIIEAQRQLAEKGTKTGFWHFTHLYPMDREKVKTLFKKGSRYVLIENNSWGQFGKLLAAETGITLEEKILKFDGRTITAEEIVKKI
ncbi:2-oxoacid:acceptor oxidoreductase subunit alpha [Candidatus Roizmanbacteria bacterium]|nr:2-oxoacid:acceptor oxidoreductase subunit alpha [Candidatus Roizmanbacteria bacterium]